MKKEEEIKQAALEAYPENIGYDSIIEKFKDYNLHDRNIYTKGEEKGYQIATDKAWKWVNEHTILSEKWFVEDFKKYMEK